MPSNDKLSAELVESRRRLEELEAETHHAREEHAALRVELAALEERHRSEIHKGLAWLDRMAAEFSDAKKVIEMAVRSPDRADQAKS